MANQLRGDIAPGPGLLVPVVLDHRLQVPEEGLHQARQAGLAPVKRLAESEHLAERAPALTYRGERDDLADGSLDVDAALLRLGPEGGVHDLQVFREVWLGIDWTGRGQSSSHKMGVLESEPAGQGARVGPSYGDPGTRHVVHRLHAHDEGGEVGEGLVGAEPGHILDREVSDGSAVSVVSVL